MKELISPEQIPQWIPGDLTLDSAPLSWEGMALKGYRYSDLDVAIPEMRDFMIVIYKRGIAEMSRRSSGRWHSETVEPGVMSILTRGEQSQWRWNKPIDVSHLYLSQAAVARVAGEVFERDIKDIEMCDLVSTKDPVLPTLVAMLEHELKEDGLGGKLYVESLKNQLCIHILRRYANIIFREHRAYGRLSSAQCGLLVQYVKENIEQNISLEDLAGLTHLTVFSLIRKFQNEFNCSPHAYVMRQRIEHAKRLLARQDMPLKVIAASSGFSDQSHMTRLFRSFFNMTPTEYRRSTAMRGFKK
ncbi:helix-turn-helix transcriptional regulator [Pseudomonas sp. Y39-6]|uniref:helix-turn-helix domain-containing protein n=1 Tax=Pseudomonas sp. Y39-6 TaxID=2749807 RepID=UPI00202D09AD|nr:AraC family transcriptional regulator [Pseudomonas sp. Y39-6]URS59058.1 helix-turn-helix transcriptional regulator [Pseudomonas sp. Y39-6]